MANFDTYSSTITANAQAFAVDTISCTGAYVVTFGTHAGVTVAFEGTNDGSTWYALSAFTISGIGSPAGTAALSTNASTQFYVLVGAAKLMRVRSTAYTSGTVQLSVMPVRDADPILLTASEATTPASPAAGTAGVALADAFANPTVGHSATDNFLYNGTTWDRARNNVSSQQVEGSAARTTTANGTTNNNYNWRGAYVLINVTAVTGTDPTLVVRLQYTANGSDYHDLDATNAVTASITTTGQHLIRVYPGLTAAAPTGGVSSANAALPRLYRPAWVIGGTATPTFTFSVFATYLV
jgi:hypothetical protein